MTTGQTSSSRLNTAPAKVLQEVVTRQLSGQLLLSDPARHAVSSWRIHFGQGKVHFATGLFAREARLGYLLYRYMPELLQQEKPDLEEFATDYDYICHFWRSGKFSLQELRQLLLRITQEALVHCLTIEEGQFQFESSVGLDPILVAIPLKELVAPVRSHIARWKRLHSLAIHSPFERFNIKDLEAFYRLMLPGCPNAGYVRSLGQTLTPEYCLYDVARLLQEDVLKLVLRLQPALEAGVLEAIADDRQGVSERPTVACIDDSHAVQRQVKLLLEAVGYQVVSIVDPARALTTMVRHRPALILMDITMPEIDGYELCSMLRQSTRLSAIPIVMLTGKDGVIDRLRARMVGANDYLTKPFDPEQLIQLVQKLTAKVKVS